MESVDFEGLDIFDIDLGTFENFDFGSLDSKNEGFADDSDSCCANCGNNDWIPEVSRGDLVCRNCGCCCVAGGVGERPRASVIPHLARGVRFERESAQAMGQAEAFARASSGKVSSTYQHVSYFDQKIACWALRESPVGDDDWAIISAATRAWCERRGIAFEEPTAEERRKMASVQKVGGREFTKEEIGDILASCDAGLSRWDQKEKQAGPRKRFMKRYFKSWMQIRYRLTAQLTTFYRVTEEDVVELRKLFVTVMRSFKSLGLYNDQKGINNYNYIFRRLFDLLNLSFCNVEFPVLLTKKAQKKADEFWKLIVVHNSWPYINTDTS